ncbi:DNA-binding protein [Bacillus sp. FSL K6-6483]
MIEISLKTESTELKNGMYDVVREVLEEVLGDLEKEKSPALLTRSQLAKEIFNVNIQTVDTHVLSRPDFPRIYVGSKPLFPRDQVMEWIRKNTLSKSLPYGINHFKKAKEA